MAEHSPSARKHQGPGKGTGAQQAGASRRTHAPLSPARRVALDVLGAVRTRRAFASEVISSMIDTSSLSVQDKAFATRLVLGVVSTRGTLDELVERHLYDKKNLEPLVRDALRISCYEIVFLKKESFAAIDQGVELVRSVTQKAVGLANAVLRKIAGEAGGFPFGDPQKDLAAFARQYAFPAWMAGLLVREFGYQGAAEFMAASNEPAPLYIAVNALKATDQEVIGAFRSCGFEAKATAMGGAAIAGCLEVPDTKSLTDRNIKRLFSQGKILVSDAASQLIAAMALPEKPTGPFLEIGAGRGTKSILLQSGAMRRFGEQLPLEVLDNHEFKVRLLEERAALYGARIDKAYVADASAPHGAFPAKAFDAVFVDAPCSGLGTLRRHPEIRWRIQPEDIDALAKASLAILTQASTAVKPGGVLTFSTCTVASAENQEVVKRFLGSASGKGFVLAPVEGKPRVATRLRIGSSDAHFAVRMERTGASV